MKEYILKEGKKLRLGYTTGSCAAAAAKAATWMLLTGKPKKKIQIETPKGISLSLDVHDIHITHNSVSCAIKKDSGDDPDVTKGTLVFAEVSTKEEPGIVIDGGKGVGRVTKQGLDQPIGSAAINSVPRQMIEENLREICSLLDYAAGLSVLISVPEGERLAKKTFNPRLGIVDGISILGTSGIVEPMSEQALIDTIRIELRQKRVTGTDYILLTPGNYGTDYIQNELGVDSKTAVRTSNYIGDTLDICTELGFKGALLVGHIGKLVKIAGGMLNTHSKYGDCRMDIIAAHAGASGLSPDKIRELMECATCDSAINILKEEGICLSTLRRISERIAFIMDQRVAGKMQTEAIFFSKTHGFLGETKNARSLLRLIVKG